MTIALELTDAVPADAGMVGIPAVAGPALLPGADPAVDVAHLTARGFEAKVGETLVTRATDGRMAVVVGMGPAADVGPETLRKAAAALVRASWKDRVVACALLDAAPPTLDPAHAAQALAEGALLASYRFGRYKADPGSCRIERLVVVGDGDGTRHGLDRGARLAEAVAFARDLVNEPASTLTPSKLAELAAEVAEREGLALTVLDETGIAAEGLGGLMGVAAGSDQPPRLLELVYDPPGAVGTLALVGKGITFDSGGLSLKTAEGMETMKTDMSGAAAVLAAMSVLPGLAPPVKVVAIIPATENMPGGRATKPGDVLRIRNGTTVEVLNTDAEGRLVLADGLSLAVEAGADAIVDLATLTGACVVALGRGIAGLMGNHESWITAVREAADRSGEKVWPLPLPDEYRRLIDSPVADIKNVGGRGAGALTAGLFLREFVGDTPWAHLDIAGPARADDDDGYVAKGGTGFGVRTLVELVERFRPPDRTAGVGPQDRTAGAGPAADGGPAAAPPG